MRKYRKKTDIITILEIRISRSISKIGHAIES